MDKVLTYLAGWKGYLAAVLVAAALAGFGGYRLAWRLQDANLAALKEADALGTASALTKALQAQRAQDKISADAATAAAAHQVPIAAHARIIREEVPVYVTPAADAACVLPIGAIRLLDAAVSGRDPAELAAVDDPGAPNDAPSGIDCSRFVALVAADFAQYRSVAQQLNDILDLAEKQSAAAPAAP